jgi:hypothetical protein
MRRMVRSLMLGAVVIAAAIVATQPSAPVAGAAHTLLHLNCPPGSHGPARFDGVGRNLMQAREAAKTSRP